GPSGPAPEPLLYRGDGQLMIIAPTGVGKGVGVIIPNLLTYAGSMIVVDVKGENFQVTARYRRRIGQSVVVLVPFGLVTDSGDGLNPFRPLRPARGRARVVRRDDGGAARRRPRLKLGPLLGGHRPRPARRPDRPPRLRRQARGSHADGAA